jgi:transcription factor IIIB subunit 2
MNARRAIAQVAANIKLPPLYVDRAYRLYQLALQRNFTFGRRQAHIVATCLYIICRQEKSPHLLIDFSDALQVNVYILGKSFLQFSHILNLNLAVVDPSLYIHRFASRMELGDKMSTVSTVALRIVTRMKKDWIDIGRRPDSICAVALLIAARAHGFTVPLVNMATMFRVTTATVTRRLADFQATPSAQLTLDQFNSCDLDVGYDPPSFIQNRVFEARSSGDVITLNLPPDDEQPESAAAASMESKDDNAKGFAIAELMNDVVFQIDNEDESGDDESNEENEQWVVHKKLDADNITSATTKPQQKGPAAFFRAKMGNVSVGVPMPGYLPPRYAYNSFD